MSASCLAEHRCTPAELVSINKNQYTAINRHEMTKTVPARYPSNQDSIGIEIVGIAALPAHKPMPAGLTAEQQQRFFNENSVYEALTAAQLASLTYLLLALQASLRIPASEVHRHPDVSYKNPTEAETAVWD